MTIFESERIRCRDFFEDDFEAVHAYASLPEVVRYMVWGPNTEEETRTFIRDAIESSKQVPRMKYELAIVDKQNQDLVGGIGLFIISDRHRTGEIGYSINPNFWRRGYGYEAAYLALQYGFEVLGLHRIQATCDLRNEGSARILEKIGMSLEGVLRDHILLRDGWRQSKLYGMLETDYFK